ncbi:MAG: YkgJ family cysteine cluster protein [Hyphomicrobium sp.]|uniref:YkgJ family cysteine cluster protein n=1 Tax=Hyphomicrobium sp. TaxID=82 RepID=UPI003D13EB3E
MANPADASPCNTCGACCAHDAGWPRFTCEADADLDRLPPELVKGDLSGMRCDGARCAALVGTVGVETSCAIYALRPDVCRACQPGDEACSIAREARGLPLIAAVV